MSIIDKSPLDIDPAPLRVTAEVDPPDLKIRLAGEIDLACAELLESVARAELVGISLVTLDLTDLTFSDLAGMRAMLKFRADHEVSGCEVRLVHAQPIVRRVFELSGNSDHLAAA